MNKLYIVFLLLFPVTSMLAQNAMFPSYERQSEFLIVENWLQEKEELQVVSHNPGKHMEVEINAASTRYDFYQGMLYQVSMTKAYTSNRDAQSAIKGTLEYFDLIDAERVANVSLGNTKYYVAIKNGRVYKLDVINLTHKHITLKLSTKFVRNTPLYDFDKYCEMIAPTPTLSKGSG